METEFDKSMYSPKFVTLNESYIMRVFDHKMKIFNGYTFMKLRRSLSEYYSIFINTDHQLVVTNSTKDGIDSVRYFTIPNIDDKSVIDNVKLYNVENELKLVIHSNRHDYVIEGNQVVDDILKKFKYDTTIEKHSGNFE